MEHEWLTTKEVAEMFRVKPKTVASWCASGKYPRRYLMRTHGDSKGSKWLIHRDALKPKAPYKQQPQTTNHAQQSLESAYELLQRF